MRSYRRLVVRLDDVLDDVVRTEADAMEVEGVFESAVPLEDGRLVDDAPPIDHTPSIDQRDDYEEIDAYADASWEEELSRRKDDYLSATLHLLRRQVYSSAVLGIWACFEKGMECLTNELRGRNPDKFPIPIWSRSLRELAWPKRLESFLQQAELKLPSDRWRMIEDLHDVRNLIVHTFGESMVDAGERYVKLVDRMRPRWGDVWIVTKKYSEETKRENQRLFFLQLHIDHPEEPGDPSHVPSNAPKRLPPDLLVLEPTREAVLRAEELCQEVLQIVLGQVGGNDRL